MNFLDSYNSISDDISLSSKKNGLETSRINTEKNIRKIFGTKNNSMERKRTKKSENNMTNITSNKTLKQTIEIDEYLLNISNGKYLF